MKHFIFMAIEHKLQEIERDPNFIGRLADAGWKQQQVLAVGKKG